LLGYWFSPWFISLINTPKHLIPSAISYLRIYFLSLISVITYNISSGIIRAANASRRPWMASNI
jgi:Na+-driven multidrug efflux pump